MQGNLVRKQRFSYLFNGVVFKITLVSHEKFFGLKKDLNSLLGTSTMKT